MEVTAERGAGDRTSVGSGAEGTPASAAAAISVVVLSDEPTEDDQFGRARHVEALTDIAATADTPLVIALFGTWGSGKTSMMRQVRRRLDPHHDGRFPERAAEIRARTVWFEPWLHQFDVTPSLGLLHAITDQLGLTGKAEVREALKKIALALAEDIRVPYLGLQLGKLIKIRNQVSEDEFRRREQQARLRTHFETVLKQAGIRERRLVVFIDDLDRCQPMRTVAVLEALKLYLNFEGCVFILGVDRDPLEAAIRAEYKDLGVAENSYLDKIVQMPFSLPAIGEDTMRTFVKARIPTQLQDCTEILVAAGADDPRQVKRVLNSMALNDRLVPDSFRPEYQPQILTALILIQTFAPALYRHLRLVPSAIHELFSGATGGATTTPPAITTETSTTDGSAKREEHAVAPGAASSETLWAQHVATRPRLAAALRLITIPTTLDLRPYLTLTAAAAAPEAPAADGATSPEVVRVVSSSILPEPLTIPTGLLASLVSTSRAALRREAEVHADGLEGLGHGEIPQAFVERLTRLAVVGRRIFFDMFGSVSPESRDALVEAARRPGLVPVAPSESVSSPPPLSIMYDHPIDETRTVDSQLCPSFVEALAASSDLTTTACWQGDCPVREDDRAVCPSGFWGLRHALALPPPRDPAQPAPDLVVGFQDLQVVVGISGDLGLAREHGERLRRILVERGSSVQLASTAESLLGTLGTTSPQLIYLFCRGEVEDGLPLLRLGGIDERPIRPATLQEGRLSWATAPVVIINSGLDGDGLSAFAQPFVGAGANGVIGPDVPLTERVASQFGERLVARLLDGQEVGWAVRDSRLDLLQRGDPMGLAYLALILPEVRFGKAAAPVPP